jgi:hypothetical protein
MAQNFLLPEQLIGYLKLFFFLNFVWGVFFYLKIIRTKPHYRFVNFYFMRELGEVLKRKETL